jgi:hypothetical protein
VLNMGWVSTIATVAYDLAQIQASFRERTLVDLAFVQILEVAVAAGA